MRLLSILLWGVIFTPLAHPQAGTGLKYQKPSIPFSILPSIEGTDPNSFFPPNLVAIDRVINPTPPKHPSPHSREHLRPQLVKGKSLLDTQAIQEWNVSTDSWENRSLLINTYNSSGDLIEAIEQESPATGVGLNNKLKRGYSYDSDHLPIEVFYYYWLDSAWTLEFRTTQSFDGQRRLAAMEYSQWWEQMWILRSRDRFSYDNSTIPVEQISEDWYRNTWYPETKLTRTFNTHHDLLDLTNYATSIGGWQPVRKQQWSYDSLFRLTSFLFQEIQADTLRNNHLELYTNDSHGDRIMSVFQYWKNATWINEDLDKMQYDDLHQQLNLVHYNWRGSTWELWARYFLTWDAFGRTIDELDQSFVSEMWLDAARTFYQYHALGNNTIKELHVFNGLQWENRRRVLSTWNSGATVVNNDRKYYQGFELSSNYPNPFNPSTEISYALAKPEHVKLTVFDLLGRVVTSLVNESKPPGRYSVTWNATSQPSGIYYYQLSAGSIVVTKRMVLAK